MVNTIISLLAAMLLFRLSNTRDRGRQINYVSLPEFQKTVTRTRRRIVTGIAATVLGCVTLGATGQQVEMSAATSNASKLIINWDTASMWAIQLAYAQRDQGVPIEKWAWIARIPGYVQRDPKPDAKGTFGPDDVKDLMEQIVDEHARAKVDCIVHCLYVMPNGAMPPGLKAVHTIPRGEGPATQT